MRTCAVGAEHPLFILYTSGSTGKPKGVQHCTGGYLLWAKMTMDWTFDRVQTTSSGARPTLAGSRATPTWLTARWRPAPQIIFEGIPTFPNAGRFWQMIERHKVHHFLHRSTAIRSLIKAAEADEAVHPARSDLSSLRILGSVGEPINPEAWMWYRHKNVGGERCPIVDTFWQTEPAATSSPHCPAPHRWCLGCTLPCPASRRPSWMKWATTCPTAQAAFGHQAPWPSMIRNDLEMTPSVSRRATSPEPQGLLPGWRRRCTQRRPWLLPHHRAALTMC